MSVKYYNRAGEYLSVESAGISEDGTQFAVYIHNGEDESRFDKFETTTDKQALENQLKEYALQNGMSPEIVYNILNENRKLQGEVINANDFIKLTDTEKATAFDNYLATKGKIENLKAEKESKIVKIKEEYKELITAEEDILASITKEALNGTRKEECNASWERDIENCTMYLIRHDNMKVLLQRPMNDVERQVCTSDVDNSETESK